jgi:hypothetical protein
MHIAKVLVDDIPVPTPARADGRHNTVFFESVSDANSLAP